MADIFRAGQFELQTAKIISASSKEVDVTLSTISVTIFEDISKFAISGSILIHDSINLASFSRLSVKSTCFSNLQPPPQLVKIKSLILLKML